MLKVALSFPEKKWRGISPALGEPGSFDQTFIHSIASQKSSCYEISFEVNGLI